MQGRMYIYIYTYTHTEYVPVVKMEGFGFLWAELQISEECFGRFKLKLSGRVTTCPKISQASRGS